MRVRSGMNHLSFLIVDPQRDDENNKLQSKIDDKSIDKDGQIGSESRIDYGKDEENDRREKGVFRGLIDVAFETFVFGNGSQSDKAEEAPKIPNIPCWE